MKRTGLLSLMGTFLLGIALVLGAAPCAAYAEVPSAEFYTNASRELNHWIQLDLEDGSHLKGMAPRTFDASCVYMGEIIPAREWNGSSLVEGQVAGYLPVYQVDADDPHANQIIFASYVIRESDGSLRVKNPLGVSTLNAFLKDNNQTCMVVRDSSSGVLYLVGDSTWWECTLGVSDPDSVGDINSWTAHSYDEA